MSFLGRVAARASAPSLGAGRPEVATAGEASPSMQSRSPLVRFDQRLTLPGFAEMAPVTARIDNAELDSADGLAGTNEATASSPMGPAVAARTAEPAAVSPPSPSPLSSSALLSPNERAALDAAPLPSVGDAFASPVVTRNDETRSSERPRSPSSDAMPLEVVATPPPAPSLAPLNVSERSSVSREVASETRAAAAEPPAELAPAGRSVVDAVARLDAWLRAEARDIGQESPVAAVPAAAPSSLDAAEPAIAPSISIGKLEIEVVPPAPAQRFAGPAREARRERPMRQAPRPVAPSGARGFGWRQR